MLLGYVRPAAKAVCGLAIAGGLLLAGCGSDPEKSPSTAATEAAKTPAPQSGHAATLADGVIFNRETYPDFVAGVTGFSAPEAWGRWTEGPRATIEFARPLPATFTMTVTAAQRGD